MSSDSKLGPQGQPLVRRRSPRLRARIRVGVEWQVENKTPFTEETETFMVSAHGALIGLDAAPSLGQKLMLQNASTNETQEAMIVFVSSAKDGKFNVGVEFTKPNPAFWQITFSPEN